MTLKMIFRITRYKILKCFLNHCKRKLGSMYLELNLFCYIVSPAGMYLTQFLELCCWALTSGVYMEMRRPNSEMLKDRSRNKNPNTKEAGTARSTVTPPCHRLRAFRFCTPAIPHSAVHCFTHTHKRVAQRGLQQHRL